MKTTTTRANVEKVTHLEDILGPRWLAQTLRPARARLQSAPPPEAVERIRARVFGDAKPTRKPRSIAA